MEYMGTKEASAKWGVSQATIAQWCKNGMIEGATQKSSGSPWRIPVDAKHPRSGPETSVTTIDVNMTNSGPGSMTFLSSECPNCGGELEFKDNNSKVLFCPFCGRKLLYNEMHWTERTVNVNKTTTIDDKAKVARAELDKIKINQENRTQIVSIIGLVIISIGLLIFASLVMFHT